MSMNAKRLLLWSNGKISDDELTADEVEWLANAVMEAINAKLAGLAQPDTVQ